MAGPIKIAVLANAAQAKRELNSVASSADGMGSKLGKAGRVAGAAVTGGLALAGAAAVKFGVSSVKAASDAQQSLGATETVFGKFAKTVISTSDTAAKQFGLSANEYRENANLLGSLFANQGVAQDKLAGKTKNMIGQAADLAATFGGTTKDAVEALGSAFKGEFDPLERYGISIKQSTINSLLAARGQDKLTGAALKQAQQIATTDLIMKQSSKTKGAFAKETNTLAHQQQVLGAQWENLKAKAGKVLLPALTALLMFVNAKLGPAFSALGRFLSPAIQAFQSFFSSVGTGQSRFAPLLAAFRSFGTFIVSTVIPALTRVGSYLVTTLGPVFAQVTGIIATRVLPIIATLAQFFVGTLLPAVARIYARVATNLKPIFDQLATTFRARVLPAVSLALAKFHQYQPTIQRVIAVVVRVIGAFVIFQSRIAGKVIPVIIRLAGFLIGRVVPAVARVIGIQIRMIGVFARVVVAVAKGVAAFGRFVGAVVRTVGRAMQAVGSIPGRVRGALGGAASILYGAGQRIIGGLINGIVSMFSRVKGALGSLTSRLTSWKGPPKKDAKLLTPAGELIIQSLVDGFDRKSPAVKKALQALSRDISTFSASPSSDVRLSASQAYANQQASRGAQTITLKLTAQEVSALQRGRQIKADIRAYERAGGK